MCRVGVGIVGGGIEGVGSKSTESDMAAGSMARPGKVKGVEQAE